jgi:hypothetical protein
VRSLVREETADEPRDLLALAAIAPACNRSASPNGMPAETAPQNAGVRGDANDPGASVTTSSVGDGAAGMTVETGPSVTIADDHTIGQAQVFENLTVFPITSEKQIDVGPMTTLEAALKKHEAEVREVGVEGAQPSPVPVPSTRHRHGAASSSAGAQVNTLVIENKGTVPIYVLAGTVVKGGNQDRQIGQDFILDAKQTAGVDAFCVEHGRWNAERNGHATEGRFDTMTQLVTSSVRAAGQYQQNQGEVWAKVADVNAANKKSAASGTLLATLDDGDVAKHRAALAGRVLAFLGGVKPSKDVVGIAYAVDGRVRGARWFVNHTIFDLYRETLANTAAVDAITAVAARDPQKPAPTAASLALAPAAVDAFIHDVAATKVKAERDTQAANVNEYREGEKGYGSKTMFKPRAAAHAPAAAAPAKAIELSEDVLSK